MTERGNGQGHVVIRTYPRLHTGQTTLFKAACHDAQRSSLIKADGIVIIFFGGREDAFQHEARSSQ
eukprot:scaffold622142_cov29-Prasinocladus_malaysianus.AAC.1